MCVCLGVGQNRHSNSEILALVQTPVPKQQKRALFAEGWDAPHKSDPAKTALAPSLPLYDALILVSFHSLWPVFQSLVSIGFWIILFTSCLSFLKSTFVSYVTGEDS